MATDPPCIDLDTAIQGFNIDNTAAYQAIELLYELGSQHIPPSPVQMSEKAATRFGLM